MSGNIQIVLTKGSTVADAADGGDGITRVARILMILLPDVMSMHKRGGRATRRMHAKRAKGACCLPFSVGGLGRRVPLTQQARVG